MMKSLRIVIFGKTGTGKSSLGNLILGKHAFESRVSASSVTRYPQESTTERRFGGSLHRLVVLDTPGFDDISRIEPKRDDNLAGFQSSVIVLVTCVGEDPQYLQDVICKLKTELGRRIMQSVVVVFTRANYLKLYDDIGKSEEYVECFPQSLQNDIRQYVFIDSDADDLDQKLQELIDIMLRIHNRKTHRYALRPRTLHVPFG